MIIHVGKHYRRSAHQYNETRKVISICEGDIHYLLVQSMESRKVKASSFAKFAGYELPTGEPANRYARVLTVGEQAVWYVFKYNFPMTFWYSLDCQAIYAETPFAGAEDHQHHFDVRKLPECYLTGLDIEGRIDREGSCDLSRLEMGQRHLAAHTIAIGRALADGFDIRAHQQRLFQEEEEEARKEKETRTRAVLFQGCQAAIDEDEMPF